jgi:hypothetical protein
MVALSNDLPVMAPSFSNLPFDLSIGPYTCMQQPILGAPAKTDEWLAEYRTDCGSQGSCAS